MVIDGEVLANGAAGPSTRGGAGGSIRLEATGYLEGNGRVEASGAPGGAGGRVAVLHGSRGVLPTLRASGGSTGAGAGTVFLRFLPDATGELWIANNGVAGWGLTPVAGGNFANLVIADGANARFTQAVSADDLHINSARAWFAETLTMSSAIPVSMTDSDVTLAAPWSLPAGMALQLDGSRLEITTTTPASLATLQLLNASVLTSRPTTATVTQVLSLNVTGAVQVDATSHVDLDGRGYLGGLALDNLATEGRTGGNQPGSAGANGSHGGLGNNWSGPTYDSYVLPSEPGGGGAAIAGVRGGSGGGALQLNAGTLVLDGLVSANGEAAPTSRGGAGGGINLDVGQLSGLGRVEANGALGSYSGAGGGRVAVVFDSAAGFDWTRVVARGVGGGGAGTVHLKPRMGLGTLVVENGGRDGTGTPLDIAGDLEELRIEGGAYAYTQGGVPFGVGLVRVDGAWGWVWHATIHSVSINASNFSLDDASIVGGALSVVDSELQVIDYYLTSTPSSVTIVNSTVRAENWLSWVVAGAIQVDANSTIHASGYSSCCSGGSVDREGSHGGLGVGGFDAYGSVLTPDTSGGYGERASPNEYAGSGGGVILLQAASLTLDGVILSNGGEGSNGRGAGAGGSVYVSVGQLGGSGSIHADGVQGSGGGRVAVYVTGSTTFDLENVTAKGGPGGGGAGTVYLSANGQTHLRLDNGGATPLAAPTPVSEPAQLDFFTARGSASALVTNDLQILTSLEASNGSARFLGFTELWQSDLSLVNANLRFEDLWWSNQPNVSLDSSTLLLPSGMWFEVTSLDLSNGSTIGITQRPGDLTIRVSDDVVVSADSRITVDGMGFRGGLTDGNPNESGEHPGGVTALGAAGSHGGPGFSPTGYTSPPEYDDLFWPSQPGAGGAGNASTGEPGGNGGGNVQLSCSTLYLDGLITANGAAGYRGGAGGTVNLDLGWLYSGPNARIEARGASFGGGGGRIAFNRADFTLPVCDASRLTGGGGPGTVTVMWPAARLYVDTFGTPTSASVPPTTLPSQGGSLLLDYLSVLNGSHVVTTDQTSATSATVDATSSFTSPNLVLP